MAIMEEQQLKFLEDTLRTYLADYMITPDDKTEMGVKIALHLYKEAVIQQKVTQQGANCWNST